MHRTLALGSAFVVLSFLAFPGAAPAADAGTKGAGMTGAAYLHAEGSFEVKITPQADDAGTGLGRMSLQKTWRGQFEGTSRGEMLTAMGKGKGNGAYVAVERVTGKTLGRKGSFSLVHRGVMTNGEQELSITVVPGSGTEDFEGFHGGMTIRIDPDGKHFYVLSGTLPGS
ncbi:MAG TPA: DUF3224 domain-containing protein [Myxococcaceae bacterium]|nr:DUF3224 domain-containing protein [Myxococcaceae bacterium]